MNIDLVEECELRLKQTRAEHQYCLQGLEMVDKLITNLVAHSEIERNHNQYQKEIRGGAYNEYQWEILDAQPPTKKKK